MADKKLFGKIAGTAFQPVGTAANVVGGAANLVGTTASVAGKAVSAVGKAANAVGEKMKDDAPTSAETASPDAEEELEVTTLARSLTTKKRTTARFLKSDSKVNISILRFTKPSFLRKNDESITKRRGAFA